MYSFFIESSASRNEVGWILVQACERKPVKMHQNKLLAHVLLYLLLAIQLDGVRSSAVLRRHSTRLTAANGSINDTNPHSLVSWSYIVVGFTAILAAWMVSKRSNKIAEHQTWRVLMFVFSFIWWHPRIQAQADAVTLWG